MARVDIQTSPDVEPQLEGPDVYQRLDASPASFGGAIAEGGKALGAGLQDAATFYGQVAADQATTNMITQVGHVLHGDPNKPATDENGMPVLGPDGKPMADTGFYGKTGAAAMSAWPQVSDQIKEIIAENREGLHTPLAQHQFDTESRRYQAQWSNETGTHADQQQKVWGVDTNLGGIQAQTAIAATSPADDAKAGQAEGAIANSIFKNGQLGHVAQGQGAMSKEQAYFEAKQVVGEARVRALLGNDATAAQAGPVMDQYRPWLAALPNYDALNHAVQEAHYNSVMVPAVNAAVAGAAAGARQTVSSGTAGISQAIGTQEWHGKGAAPTSIDGAVGPSQIKPDTARQYGLDPAQLHDPAYAAQAKDVIISKLSALPNVQGDPARIAVGYFSGEKNIAPIGSPTPWIHDTHDGNGKYVSSYVSDVTGRMQGAGGAYPTTADSLLANRTSFQNNLQALAEQKFPDRPDWQERMVDLGMRKYNSGIQQLDDTMKVDSHIVEATVAATNPISMDQLRSDPGTASALDRMMYENPYGYVALEKRLDANAHGAAINFGGQFSNLLTRAMADPSDPSAITRPDQLNTFVGHGKNAFITNTGIQTITSVMKLNQGPAGHAQVVQIRQFLGSMKGNLTTSNPATGTVDPVGDDKYAQFSSVAIPALVNAAKNGTLAKVLDPKSPDYIGSMATPFMRSQAEIIHDQIYRTVQTPPAPAHVDPVAIGRQLDGIGDHAKQLEALKSMIGHGISREVAINIATQRGLIRPPSPPPPLAQ